jgi:amino acid transporter
MFASPLTRFLITLIVILDLLNGLSISPTPALTRLTAFLLVTFCIGIHGFFLTFGLRLQNILGSLKLLVLVFIALCGVLSAFGVEGFRVREGYEPPDNLSSEKIWEGSNMGLNALMGGLYSVI